MLYLKDLRGRWFLWIAIAVAVLFALPANAAPYLHTGTEYSKARSQKECENFAAKAAHTLAQRGHMKVDQRNRRLGWTSDTTIYVDCIFVGLNAQKRNQWIYYISSASTKLNDANKLRSALINSLRKIAPID